jgi:uncharacterized repeat protein (TIGR03803 family)
MLPSMLKFKLLVVLALSTLTLNSSTGQTFRTLVVFNGTNGATPVDTPLVQGTDGNLYGTTLGGGDNSAGTVFKLTPAGTLTTIYSFCSLSNCADGSEPYGGLVLGRDGKLYGTTLMGGGNTGSGTIFRIDQNGILSTLHIFSGTDGSGPAAPMILASDGNFYGITMNGGLGNSGTIFKITPSGTFKTLYDFGSGGGFFLNGPLVQGADGNFYGTTEAGGAYDHGTIFRLTPSGVFSTFFSFNLSDGSAPACGLLAASDGNLYGTTYQGGAGSNGCPNGCGTVFKITLNGKLTTLHSFRSIEGADPIAGLIQATDGNFYGTTYGGGDAGGWGVVFKMTPSGSVTTLHSFTGTDGAQPYGPVTQTTGGTIYGTSTNGTGGASQGTVFGISTGLGQNVKFVSNVGRIGQTAGILGQGFTSATSVSFNGISATFSIHSRTFIEATVPVGATTGFVTVTTANGTVTSDVQYRVLP